MTDIFTILLTSILVENFVLSKFLGICPFLGVSKKISSAMGMSAAVTFVMVMATVVTYPIYAFILLPAGLSYLQTMAFILIIATFVQLVEIALKKYAKPLHKSLGVYLPLITTNCAVLGVTLLNWEENYNFIESVVNSLGAGIGFGIAIILFAGVRGRMEGSDIPESFKGMPIALIAASLVAMSFGGFSGIV